ncbi:hypothetical protein CDAR_177641 [Caerostris darwini]|uniref:Uncharacterized protein n=1 Tax=Caerostris darwini TaxID=1538125 RepID=A0AAV4P329_9ARAC|nr:hypothetical protein CDAR_177641 [Caerostris darwini]
MSFCATKSPKMSHFGVSPEDMIQMMRKTSHITRSQVFLINVTMIDAFRIPHTRPHSHQRKRCFNAYPFSGKISSDAPPRSGVVSVTGEKKFFDRNMTYFSYIIKVLRGKAWRYL